jgi:hypothetical protein
MSPGGANPLTSPTWFSLWPTRFSSASKRSSCSTPWMTPKAHQVTWSWILVICPGRQTTAMIENEPSGSTCSGWSQKSFGEPGRCSAASACGLGRCARSCVATSCAVSAQSAWAVTAVRTPSIKSVSVSTLWRSVLAMRLSVHQTNSKIQCQDSCDLIDEIDTCWTSRRSRGSNRIPRRRSCTTRSQARDRDRRAARVLRQFDVRSLVRYVRAVRMTFCLVVLPPSHGDAEASSGSMKWSLLSSPRLAALRRGLRWAEVAGAHAEPPRADAEPAVPRRVSPSRRGRRSPSTSPSPS